MSTPTRSGRAAFTSLALLVAAVVTPACGTFGTDPAGEASADPAAPGGDTPKAKEVDGTPDASEITEELGVFVAARGRDGNPGDRQNPLLTIQAGIERGKKLGKRVYVCSGTYREALTLSDSIAIIGGLSCDLPTWKAGGAPSRIESPTSPALSAKDITTTTRLEGLDVVAPNASEPSASSIGLLADRAPGLVIVSSKITAGNGARGIDGASGIQLAPAASVAGLPSVVPFKCVAGGGGGGGVMLGTCSLGVGGWIKPPKGAGAVPGTCVGAPGHDGGAGGAGGAGGLWEPYFDSV
ncbi:MAG TPA: hypothetical protein VLT33_34910, partial [Labilithrix sp.]|nr:hypothetical protein [Labilithrix sp.]